MCAPQGVPGPDGSRQINRGHMDEDLYQKIIQDLSQYSDQIGNLSLFMDGDPLVDRKLPQRIRAAKDAGMRTVRIATNGMLLRGSMAEALLESGLDSIIVSIDSIDPNRYAEIRVGGNLKTIQENIANFIHLRQIAGRSLPQLDVRMIEMPENADEKEGFREYWASIADDVLFQKLHNWGTSLGDLGGAVSQGQPCNWPFQDMVIYSDGRAGFCCLDYLGIYELGDFRYQTLEEIWHGEAYRELRDNMKHGNWEQLPKCRGCNFASLKPLMPNHWKKLLINNRTDDQLRLHLEFDGDGELQRSASRSISARSLFTWGISYREGAVRIVVDAENPSIRTIDLHPAQVYYNIDYD